GYSLLDRNQCERVVDSSHGSILGPSLSVFHFQSERPDSDHKRNDPDVLKRVDLFALAIYGLIVFPKVLGHIEVAVVDFFKKLRQGINPVPTILAETLRSLNSCRRKGEGIFIGCSQLLNNLRAEDITWRAPWIRPSVLLYKCGNQDWVPLLGLWRGVGYAPLMLHKKGRDIANSWRKIYLMELALYVDTITVDYDIWRQRRVKNQLTPPTNYAFQNPFSEEMPFELEMEKCKFERKSSAEWKEEISNIKGRMEFWKAKAKKKEERAARAMIELRKKNVEYKTVSVELTANDLLKVLEEKHGQHDRDIRAYERALQEKDMHLGGLINEIRKAAVQITQLSNEAEALSCQFPPSQRSSMSEFLERVKK
ncbi:hypothetical protein Goarm_023398, partial [Gossypium armourianum]|nr:hypothetical protein [Gossypium armourianum]